MEELRTYFNTYIFKRIHRFCKLSEEVRANHIAYHSGPYRNEYSAYGLDIQWNLNKLNALKCIIFLVPTPRMEAMLLRVLTDIKLYITLKAKFLETYGKKWNIQQNGSRTPCDRKPKSHKTIVILGFGFVSGVLFSSFMYKTLMEKAVLVYHSWDNSTCSCTLVS